MERDPHARRFGSERVDDLRETAVYRGLVESESAAWKLKKPALVALLQADESTRFASRPSWTRTNEDPHYGTIAELVKNDFGFALPTLRAVVTEYGGAQDDLRVEVLADHPEHDDVLTVVADVRVRHDAINTVRHLHWEGSTLSFTIDAEGDDAQRRTVGFSDYAVFSTPSVRATKPKPPRRA